MEYFPLGAANAAGRIAVNWVLLMKVVGKSTGIGAGNTFELNQPTLELGTKFVPVTVSNVSGLNSGTFVGETEASVGTGFVAPVGGGVCQSNANPFESAGPAPTFQLTPFPGEVRIPVDANWP